MLTKSLPSHDDLRNISNGMKEAFQWYRKWMEKPPKTDEDWDTVVAESGEMWKRYEGYLVIQNVIIELMTDLERWQK